MKKHISFFRSVAFASLLVSLIPGWIPAARAQDPAPADPFPESIVAACLPAPAPGPLYLQPGDRLAICGDSITEQKIYSRLIETYLTVCVPDLKVAVRQYGWSGETAEGFLRRMTNDCLRFKPTIATTCYGMNDFKYRPYDDANGKWYEDRYAAVAQAFKTAGARVVLGSAGCVGKVASWVKAAGGTVADQNASLARFRNHALAIAEREGVRFADVFRPMVLAGQEARRRFGPDFAIAGKDGVHPGGAGHLVMAYAYLKAMGLDGDLGSIRVDMKAGKAEAAGGHRVDNFKDGVVTLTSRRYPFCVTGSTNTDDSVRAGVALVPFHADLNRLTLVVRNGTAARYRIAWGAETRTYAADRLAEGVNLAGDFAVNPFCEAFARVDAAVGAKQGYETKQIKKIFHGPEGKADMEAAVKRTEEIRAPLAAAIEAAFVPVTHTLKIEAE